MPSAAVGWSLALWARGMVHCGMASWLPHLSSAALGMVFSARTKAEGQRWGGRESAACATDFPGASQRWGGR
eukprot:9056183-Pyramimonas_sp.AAC.1